MNTLPISTRGIIESTERRDIGESSFYTIYIYPPPKESERDRESEIKREDICALIVELPDDIKMYIYKEYLEPEVYYQYYLDKINHNLSTRLDGTILRPLIPSILSKKNVLQYICKKCHVFRDIYIDHKIEKKKGFIKMKKGNSLTMSILFTLYH